MSFGMYLFGIVLVVGGILYGAAMLHVPAHWIVVAGVILLGVGVLMAVKATRLRDPS